MKREDVERALRRLGHSVAHCEGNPDDAEIIKQSLLWLLKNTGVNEIRLGLDENGYHCKAPLTRGLNPWYTGATPGEALLWCVLALPEPTP